MTILRIRNISLSMMAAASTGIAHGGQPAEVSVAGRIKPPTPMCTVLAPREVQYGVIPLEKIRTDGATLLDKKGFDMKIACDESAKFTVQFVDTRQATAVDDAAFLAEVAQSHPGIRQDEAFGLGLDSTGRKIGAMFLKIDHAAYMPNPHYGFITSAKTIYQVGGNWVHNEAGRVRHQTQYVFTDTNRNEPVPVGTAYVTVGIAPALDSRHLDLTKKIDVSGKFTIEISQI